MNIIKAFNKATKKFSDYFNYIEKELDPGRKDIGEILIPINSQILLWIYDEQNDDEQIEQVFLQKYSDNFKVYNLTPRKIIFKKSQDKVSDFRAPDSPSYTLEYLIKLSISAKNFLATPNNILIIHDDDPNGKIFCLLSCIISFTSQTLPMDAFFNLESVHPSLKPSYQKSEAKNHCRYLNYFTNIQNSPIISLKKYFLQSIIINGAPAIENTENSMMSPYITINKNSFYSPVVRITSKGKTLYCSYDKTKPVEKILYSPENAAKFTVDSLIFGDICLEVLHKSEKSFRLLFTIQFNTFFIEENAVRFSRDQIDCVCKDIRYPNEFFVDLLFDQRKDIDLSSYDEDSIKWKSLLSELILKGYKKKEEKEEEEKKEEKKEESSEENKEKEKKVESAEDTKEKEELSTPSSSTVKEVQNLLEKMGGDKEEDNEDEDEDVENYLKNLENKAK